MNALAKLYKPPMVGMLAFLVVLLTQPIGHTVMILTEEIFGDAYLYHVAIAMGLFGAALVYIGAKKDIVPATWYGYFGGTFIWSFWAEFSFVYYADLLEVQPLMENGEVAILPEYLVMPSSLGVLMATVAFFFLNQNTRCNFFRWFHRNLYMGMPKPTAGRFTNVSAIVAIETIFIIWFFYLVLLVLYEEALIGATHPVTYISFFGFAVWSLYLFRRLSMYTRLASAIRYAIPTAIITWTCVEILDRWGLFEEFWIEPSKYAIEVSLLFGTLVAFTLITMWAPPAKQVVEEA